MSDQYQQLSESAEEIERLRTVPPWSAEFQLWKDRTGGSVEKLFGTRGLKLFQDQGSVVLSDEAYQRELSGRRTILEGLIKYKDEYLSMAVATSPAPFSVIREVWYKSWWMKYIVYPLLVTMAAAIIIYFVLGIGKSVPLDLKATPFIVTQNQSGGNNTIVNNPPSPLRIREDFAASSLKKSFTASSSDQILHLFLKQVPLPGSVEIWWGAMSITPLDYRVGGSEIRIDLDKNQAEAIEQIVPGSSDEPSMSFVVTYVPN